MPEEIERKFLLRQLPEACRQLRPVEIEQGYIAISEEGREVRLRTAEGQYWLTVKSEGGMARQEYEVGLTADQFETLWPLTEGRRIRKSRFLLEKEAYRIEIDQYHQPLNGLLVAEVEFTSERAALFYNPEPWMDQEITHLNVLKNKRLLHFHSYQELLAELEKNNLL